MCFDTAYRTATQQLFYFSVFIMFKNVTSLSPLALDNASFHKEYFMNLISLNYSGMFTGSSTERILGFNLFQ